MEKFEKFLLGIIIGMVFCMIVFILTSCSGSRYIKEGPNGSCGVWYPKKCKIGTKNW